jgi:cell wall-associated NlpC family hydrolase
MGWRAWKGFAIVAAVLTSACASTGAVPRPFPGAKVYQGTKGSQGSQGSDGSQGSEGSRSSEGSTATEGSPTSPGSVLSVSTYALIGTALSLRGTPYRNGGTDPSGFDCSGFTQYVFAQHGVALARDVREQFRQGKSIDSRELSPGDLVFFSTTDPGASHVAIAVGGDEFVHAPSSSGVVRVEHLSSSYWSQRYVGARRYSN